MKAFPLPNLTVGVLFENVSDVRETEKRCIISELKEDSKLFKGEKKARPKWKKY